MNKETFEALKKVMHHCEYGGANDKEFWDNFKTVEAWIEEEKQIDYDMEQECKHFIIKDDYGKEYCQECGKYAFQK